MTSRRRWLIVVVGILLLCGAPWAVSKIPVGSSDISARTLLARINASADVPYSGYAQVDGGLALPSADRFGDVADLFGGQTQLRVWWRAPKDWRVDAIALTGETDVHQDASGLWTWDYEGSDATRVDFSVAPSVRLPRADDLVPAQLARRLLADASAGEVSRLPDRRIAGETAAGLRLRPAEAQSTIASVDVWALPSDGLPLAVEVHGKSGGTPISSTLLDVDTSKPAGSTTAFTPPAGAHVRNDDVTDIVGAVNRFVQGTPPTSLAGLKQVSTTELGSVGVYGRGVTVLVAIPLPARLAGAIEQQLGAAGDDAATALAFGPLELRLTARDDLGARWLLAGTVTAATLEKAEAQLPPVQNSFR